MTAPGAGGGNRFPLYQSRRHLLNISSPKELKEEALAI